MIQSTRPLFGAFQSSGVAVGVPTRPIITINALRCLSGTRWHSGATCRSSKGFGESSTSNEPVRRLHLGTRSTYRMCPHEASTALHLWMRAWRYDASMAHCTESHSRQCFPPSLAGLSQAKAEISDGASPVETLEAQIVSAQS
jgi:hypothetical protein